jgi:phosphoserine phosphatase
MLAWATRGVAVNPNSKLRKLAMTEGFEVVDWGTPD